MNKTKLVSVRLDEEKLKTIDRCAAKSLWYKRSNYINAAISFMAWAIENHLEKKLLSFYPEHGDVVTDFKFEYHREHK